MSRKYEATIVLDTKGKEEGVDALVSQLTRSFEENGAKLQQVDSMGKKKFPYNPRHVESGYFVTFFFDAEPAAVDKIQAKLKLNDNIYQQYFQRR
jgi:small subunit ribosomal protein S6